jgi:hypothetical protein
MSSSPDRTLHNTHPSSRSLLLFHRQQPSPELDPGSLLVPCTQDAIKALLLGVTLQSPPRVAAQLSEALSLICGYDFPAKCESVFNASDHLVMGSGAAGHCGPMGDQPGLRTGGALTGSHASVVTRVRACLAHTHAGGLACWRSWSEPSARRRTLASFGARCRWKG